LVPNFPPFLVNHIPVPIIKLIAGERAIQKRRKRNVKKGRRDETGIEIEMIEEKK
jgi:hypothetical protein